MTLDQQLQLWALVSNWVIVLITVVLGYYSVRYLKAQNTIIVRQNKLLNKQAVIERDSLKLDLHDRRMEILGEVMEVLAAIPSMSDEEVTDEFVRRFSTNILHGQFILGEGAWAYVLEVKEKLRELASLHEDRVHIHSAGVTEIRRLKKGQEERSDELREWFKRQPEVAIEKFREDLDIKGLMGEQ